MIFRLEKCKIFIDTERTKMFYQKTVSSEQYCDCDSCLNFRLAISSLSQDIKKFFVSLGIDMYRFCECYVNGMDKNKKILYSGFYHVCGHFLEHKNMLAKKVKNVIHKHEKTIFCLTSDFKVYFHEELALLETNFPLPAIQLEFLATIPWILKKDNPYL